MFIRPYTVSQLAIVLLSGFLLLYLRTTLRPDRSQEQNATRWMMQALIWGNTAIIVTMLSGISEYLLLDLLSYLRVCFALLFWNAIARGIYALPSVSHNAAQRDFQPVEARRMTQVILFLAGFELVYFAIRYRIFLQTEVFPARPPILEFPLFATGVWVFALLIRKLWNAERVANRSYRENLRQAILTPQGDEGRFYRWFMLVAVSLMVVNIIQASLSQANLPVLLLMASDLLVAGAIITAQFAYLGYQGAPIGLEMRVIGAGLVIFLGLVSVLGWLIAFAFLRQEAPNVPPIVIIGGQVQTSFAVPPIYYQSAALLSNLLQPLLWFELVGSVCFVLTYQFYYRRTLKTHFAQIIDGFAQVEQGNLAFRIPPVAWQDEFTQIITSFNQMAQSLDESHRQILAYQRSLQSEVAARTAELTHEIEHRRDLELRQGIQDERARIARETHDGLLQTLMALRMRLNRGKRLSQQQPVVIQQEMQEMAEEVTQSIQDLRDLLQDLNTKFAEKGLLSSFEAYLYRQQRSYPVIFHTKLEYPTGTLTEVQELNLLRILQEAVTNALRHSKASEIWIDIRACSKVETSPILQVQVRDNGLGFDSSQEFHTNWGLKNMQWRAKQLRSTLQVESTPQIGTVISLMIPIQAI